MQGRRRCAGRRPLPSPWRCTLERIEELSHTADVGFRLEADTVEGLFRAAATALRHAVGHQAERPGSEPEPIRLEQADLERLLVAWLRELLAKGEARDAVPEPIGLRVVEATGGGFALQALVRWDPHSAAGPTREIKGVTYHGLEVRHEGDVWRATVVLDV